VKFKDPHRLMVVFHTMQPSRRGLAITLRGLSPDGSIQEEIITNLDLLWEPGTGYSASRQLFKSVQKVEVSGLTSSGKVVITTMDASFTDPTCILPLWAGLTDLDQLEQLLGSVMPNGSREILLSNKRKGDIHFPWLQFLGEGLLELNQRDEAVQLVTRMMDLTVQSLKQQGSFFAGYDQKSGIGVGERNKMYGLAPLGLFLETLGVRIISSKQVRLEGKNPFPWPVTLRYRGLVVTRHADHTEITFPDGKKVEVNDAQPCMVYN
jgi:hypothetical protein